MIQYLNMIQVFPWNTLDQKRINQGLVTHINGLFTFPVPVVSKISLPFDENSKDKILTSNISRRMSLRIFYEKISGFFFVSFFQHYDFIYVYKKWISIKNISVYENVTVWEMSLYDKCYCMTNVTVWQKLCMRNVTV